MGKADASPKKYLHPRTSGQSQSSYLVLDKTNGSMVTYLDSPFTYSLAIALSLCNLAVGFEQLNWDFLLLNTTELEKFPF